MRKTFRYRIFPTHKQVTALNNTLDSCRWLYNHFLEQRKNAWEHEKKNISHFNQANTLKQLKEDRTLLKTVHSQVLQNVSLRIDLAFKAFFRRVKSGEKPGYPRFRSKLRYDSFTYPQSGFKLLRNVVRLSKIGSAKIKLHRPIEGEIKTCTVKRTPTGKWFVNFSCEIEHNQVKKATQPAVGIDVGLICFATLSNGENIGNPRFFKNEEEALAKAQRKLSKQKKATSARVKAQKVVARIHERINNKRHNFAHQLSSGLVEKYNAISAEDLNINNMKKDNFRCMNRSISDAAWGTFLECLRYKAECAGSHYIPVNPAYTSQTCSGCGNRQKLKLSDRTYSCRCCGLSIGRDHNAAINILTLGMQSLDQLLAEP